MPTLHLSDTEYNNLMAIPSAKEILSHVPVTREQKLLYREKLSSIDDISTLLSAAYFINDVREIKFSAYDLESHQILCNYTNKTNIHWSNELSQTADKIKQKIEQDWALWNKNGHSDNFFNNIELVAFVVMNRFLTKDMPLNEWNLWFMFSGYKLKPCAAANMIIRNTETGRIGLFMPSSLYVYTPSQTPDDKNKPLEYYYLANLLPIITEYKPRSIPFHFGSALQRGTR